MSIVKPEQRCKAGDSSAFGLQAEDLARECMPQPASEVSKTNVKSLSVKPATRKDRKGAVQPVQGLRVASWESPLHRRLSFCQEPLTTVVRARHPFEGRGPEVPVCIEALRSMSLTDIAVPAFGRKKGI